MRIHFVLGIENKPAYINMAKLCAWSIRHRAGAMSDARISVVFNDEGDEGAMQDLKSRFDVDARALPRVSPSMPYLNKYTALHAPDLDQADWVILLDADTAIINPLDPLADRFASDEFDFAGVPVLDSPIWGLDQILIRFAGVSRAKVDASRHPWFDNGFPYFNGGFFAVRGDMLEGFREPLVPFGEAWFKLMRASGRGVRHWMRIQWNRTVAETKFADRLVRRPFVAKGYADQVAIPVSVFKNRMRWEVLPHAYNWRKTDTGHGEDSPIRILHYLRKRYPVDRDHLFEGDWIEEYAASDHPGRHALGTLVGDYVNDESAIAADPAVTTVPVSRAGTTS